MKEKRISKKDLVTLAIVIVAFIVVNIMMLLGLTSRHLESLLVPICINVILAVSLNIVIGFLGELSLGHAGFMSVGAYSGCLFSIYMKDILPTAIRFPLAILVGGLIAAIFGLIIAIPVLRLKGDYLAIVTLAFGEIIRSVIINLDFTGGASGLKGTPQDSTFTAGFILVMITLIFTMNFVSSKHGRSIMALRDNRIAAESCGININYFKALAFVVSAFFAGVAGVLYGHNLSILTAGNFDYNKSIEILVMVVLGGMGSIRGSLVSATLITVLPEALRFLSDYRMLIYAVVLIIVMLANGSPKFKEFIDSIGLKDMFKKDKKKNEMKGDMQNE